MPTPFTHLACAQRLLGDAAVSAHAHDLITAHLPAYLLGGIAADGHVKSVTRQDTHFYSYDEPITTPPWRVMLDQFPALKTPHDDAHHAFLAGYVVHLAMDAVWATDMLRAQFVDREWGSRGLRFLVLHVMLTRMDERDYATLDPALTPQLCAAEPRNWLPFLSDDTLIHWRDVIGRQLPPEGKSETLTVMGGRVGKQPEELKRLAESDGFFAARIWPNIPQATLEAVETRMWHEAETALGDYLDG